MVAFSLLLSAALTASGFDVRQEFPAERFQRGNENCRPMQPIDAAAWIWIDGEDARFDVRTCETKVVRFRKRFAATAEPLRVALSADQRYVLTLDGREISRGPHPGFPQHWYYQSLAVDGLDPGEHVLEATVFVAGRFGPSGILTLGQGGFILKAEGSYDRQLTTGTADWEGAVVTGTRFTGATGFGRREPGTEIDVTGTGYLDPAAASVWRPAVVTYPPVTDSEYGRPRRPYPLFPTERRNAFVRSVTGAGRFKAGTETPEPDPTNHFYTADMSSSSWIGPFDALVRRGERLVVPPRTQCRVLWDLEGYYCAYPRLVTSGGTGATVRWGWQEALFDFDPVDPQKHDRRTFAGRRFIRAMTDTFRCDGRPRADFTTPWWRSGRWCEIEVKTSESPLTIERLAFDETRYPFEPAARFACDDESVADIVRIGERGLQCCLHEMMMDCPFYEQQMYPGDTRVQSLVLSSIGGPDIDRMLRFAAVSFGYGLSENGLVPMASPGEGAQRSATFTMLWIALLGDRVRWQADNGKLLKAQLPAVRHALSSLANWENADSLLERLPGWSFVDWVEDGWDGYRGRPGPRLGVSSVVNLQYVQALKGAAEIERAFGERAFADFWRTKAARTGAAVFSRFWDGSRGLVADDVAKTTFSEHAQALALLTDVLPADVRERCFQSLVEDSKLVRTSFYFSHYLFETYFRFGRADLFFRRLEPWREFARLDLKTPLEAGGVWARSDCHAWGSHPIYHLHANVAGIRPSVDGFAAVRIAPQPGPLASYRAVTPTPKGEIVSDLRFAGGKVSGSVTVPDGLPAVFVWKGREISLRAGKNAIDDDICKNE